MVHDPRPDRPDHTRRLEGRTPLLRPPGRSSLRRWLAGIALELLVTGGASAAILLSLPGGAWRGWLLAALWAIPAAKWSITALNETSARLYPHDFLYIRRFGAEDESPLQRRVNQGLWPRYGFVGLLPPPRSHAQAVDEQEVRIASGYSVRTVHDARWKEAVRFLMEGTRGTILEASRFSDSLQWEAESAVEAHGPARVLVVADEHTDLQGKPLFQSWLSHMGADELSRSQRQLEEAQITGKVRGIHDFELRRLPAVLVRSVYGQRDFEEAVADWARERLPLDRPEARARTWSRRAVLLAYAVPVAALVFTVCALVVIAVLAGALAGLLSALGIVAFQLGFYGVLTLHSRRRAAK